MRSLPAFSKLWSHYPHGSAEEAKATIGGSLNMSWVTNTCAIRVCHALNLSGFKIAGAPGVNTARGGNKMRYIFRVRELDIYIRSEVGRPALTVKDPSMTDFTGEQGIICFEVAGWSDATGHFDLWNGSECAHKAYFANAQKAHLWTC